jgi:hypothetical protein
MTPKESHIKIWFTRWHDSKSVEDNCTLNLVSVEEMASTSSFTSGSRWWVPNIGRGKGCSWKIHSKEFFGVMGTWMSRCPSCPSYRSEVSNLEQVGVKLY